MGPRRGLQDPSDHLNAHSAYLWGADGIQNPFFSSLLAGGIDFILADVQSSDQIGESVSVYNVGTALFFPGGIALGFGGFIFALGLSTRKEFNRIISLLAALVSLAVMVFFMIAILHNEGRETFISLARGSYVLLVIWYGYLGMRLMNRPDPDLWQ